MPAKIASLALEFFLVDRYASIRDKYPNLIGRLIIHNYNGENDLTVMQTPDEPDYYLYRDAEGKYSQFGTAYLDYRCSVENLTDNFMIYAHNIIAISVIVNNVFRIL